MSAWYKTTAVKLISDLREYGLATEKLRLIKITSCSKEELAEVVELLAEQHLLLAVEMLDLNGNQLEFLPENFGQLRALIRLYLLNNQLQSLPESFGQLKRLKLLYLDSNQFQLLPECIVQCEALQELYCRNNPLQSLPVNIPQMKALTHFEFYEAGSKAFLDSCLKTIFFMELYLRSCPRQVFPESIELIEMFCRLQWASPAFQLETAPLCVFGVEKEKRENIFSKTALVEAQNDICKLVRMRSLMFLLSQLNRSVEKETSRLSYTVMAKIVGYVLSAEAKDVDKVNVKRYAGLMFTSTDITRKNTQFRPNKGQQSEFMPVANLFSYCRRR